MKIKTFAMLQESKSFYLSYSCGGKVPVWLLLKIQVYHPRNRLHFKYIKKENSYVKL